MKKILCFLLVCLLLCGSALGEDTRLVCSFYPVYLFTLNAVDGIEGVLVSRLTPPAAGCLHDYQLLTGDMRALSKADAFIVNGAGMETFLPEIQTQLPNLPVIDCSAGVALLSDEHGENAHIWLDAKNAAQMVKNISENLQTLLPAHADKINANADAYIERLTALDAQLAEGLQNVTRRDIVTFHEAFPYFAAAYGLNIVGSATLDPDESPSPLQLAKLAQIVREHDNCPLFTEPNEKSDALKTIAAETGAPVYALDPVTDGDGAPDDYEQKMLANLSVLQEALRVNTAE